MIIIGIATGVCNTSEKEGKTFITVVAEPASSELAKHSPETRADFVKEENVALNQNQKSSSGSTKRLLVPLRPNHRDRCSS